MMSCNTPSIAQSNEAVELSFFSMDIQFSSRLSLICGAWVTFRAKIYIQRNVDYPGSSGPGGYRLIGLHG